MKKIVYILTSDPKERIDLISSAYAQALTALSFGYACEIFIMDSAVKLFNPKYIAGLKSPSFDPLAELIRHYNEMGGKTYGCNPSLVSHKIKLESGLNGVDGEVNASKLLESSLEADAVFTY